MSSLETWIRIYRATLDTNIFLRALIRQGNLCHRILEFWMAGRFVLVLSPAILDEIREVLSRPSLVAKYQYSLTAVSQLVDLIAQRAILVEPPFSLHLCRDAKDNPFVDCAILGRVHFLVSYDQDLLADAALKQALFEYGVEICSAPIFLQKLQEAQMTSPINRL